MTKVPESEGRDAVAIVVGVFGSPLRPGSRFAARMAEFLALRAEIEQADRELEHLRSTAPVAGTV